MNQELLLILLSLRQESIPKSIFYSASKFCIDVQYKAKCQANHVECRNCILSRFKEEMDITLEELNE